MVSVCQININIDIYLKENFSRIFSQIYSTTRNQNQEERQEEEEEKINIDMKSDTHTHTRE